MRVAVHADAAGHAIPGGIGSYVRGLVGEIARDPDVSLVVSRSTAVPSAWPAGAVVRSPLPLRAMYVAWNVLRAPSVGDFDLVHATGLVIPPASGARLIAMIHDDTVQRFPELVPRFWRALYRRGFRIALREAAVLCANSGATKRRLVDAYGVDADRVVVTPLAPAVSPGHPTDDTVLARLGIRPPYVLHVGTLEPRKNQAALVRAFAAARLVDHRLVLAGAPGWGADAVDAAIEASGMRERIVVTGAVTDAQLAALYASADAFAFPSVYEGFGVPLVEAMSFGLPCLISRDEALVEAGGDAVVTVDPRDEAAFAKELIRVCTDENLRAVLRTAGVARAARYSWTACADATRDAWRRALDTTTRPV
jgi:glycosyltransferase involved in cell wall biosynthesis